MKAKPQRKKDSKKAKKSKTVSEIRKTRKDSVLKVWERVVFYYKERHDLVAVLNPVLLEKVIEAYVQEYRAFRAKYKITGRLQRHKIAGLMAAMIMKYRPVLLADHDHSPAPTSYTGTQGNELLAFWHGLAVCGEGSKESDLDNLVKRWEGFGDWMDDTLHLFEQHPDSCEAFVAAFGTLSHLRFPDNFRP